MAQADSLDELVRRRAVRDQAMPREEGALLDHGQVAHRVARQSAGIERRLDQEGRRVPAKLQQMGRQMAAWCRVSQRPFLRERRLSEVTFFMLGLLVPRLRGGLQIFGVTNKAFMFLVMATIGGSTM